MNRVILNAIISAGLVAAAPIALAQHTGEGGQVQRQAEQRQYGQRASRLPSERVEARLAYLKTALKITEAQQPQWDAFADTLRKQARGMDERIKPRGARAAGSPQNVTAIERLERRKARLAAASARLSEVLAAAKPLYAALSPEQQKIADELLNGRHSRFRHGHRRGRA